MKRTIVTSIVALLILCVFSLSAYGAAVTSSGQETASKAIRTSRCAFAGIIVATDGTNDVTVDVYDNADGATGTRLVPQFVVDGADDIGGILFEPVVKCQRGIYVDITTAGTCKYVIYYID